MQRQLNRWTITLIFSLLSITSTSLAQIQSLPPIQQSAFQTRYVATSLSSGWSSDAAFALNDKGWVAGQSHLRSFVWIPNSPNSPVGSTHLLTELSPSAPSAGLGIDPTGKVVGTARNAFLKTQPVTWTPGVENIAPLSLPSNVLGGHANGINRDGIIVGATGLSSTDMRPARWLSDGTLHDLGLPTNSRYAFATAINSSGVIAGGAELNGSQVAWRYDGDFDFLPLPGSSSFSDARAINSDGLVVGAGNGAWWSDGSMTSYLSQIPGTLTARSANGVNDREIIVGTAIVGSTGQIPVGAIWFGRNGPGFMLDDLLAPSHSDYIIREAYAINNFGQIAAAGTTPQGVYTAMLLTPVKSSALGPIPAIPEPALASMTLALALIVTRRRSGPPRI